MEHKLQTTLMLTGSGFLVKCSCGWLKKVSEWSEIIDAEAEHDQKFPSIRTHIDRVRTGKSTFIPFIDVEDFFKAATEQERKGYCPVIWKVTPCERGITVFGLTKEEQNA